MRREPAIGARPGGGVEVAEQHEWRAASRRADPVRAEDRLGLGKPLGAGQPEMSVHHLKLALRYRDLDPQRAARLQGWTPRVARQRIGPHEARGMRGQDRVAVALLEQMQGGMEVVDHLEEARDLLGLVEPP